MPPEALLSRPSACAPLPIAKAKALPTLLPVAFGLVPPYATVALPLSSLPIAIP